MDNLIETISFTFSLSALVLVLSIFLFNLYLIKKNGFYVNANCWFCNTWTKVLYAERNSFECPSCLQYNGFQDDGGYNRVIEAQHATVFNKVHSNVKTDITSNGLCTYCNNNQQLKIIQLANFTPLNEDNFDVEVEHFRQQLEKAYKLCKKCERVLKSTINKQNAWIFGNRLNNLRKQGMKLIDLTKSSHGFTKEVKQSFYLKSIKCILILLTILMICQILNVKVDYPTPTVNMKKYTPKAFGPYKIILMDALNLLQNKMKNIQEEIVQSLSSYNLPRNVSIKNSSTALMSCVGFLLQIIVVCFERRSKIWKLNELLAWCVLVITSSVTVGREFAVFQEVLKVFSSFMLLYSYLAGKTSTTSAGNISKKKFEFKKLKSLEDEITDEDEGDDLIENHNNLSTSNSSSTQSRQTSYKEFNAVNKSSASSSPIRSRRCCSSSVFSDTAHTLNRSYYTAKSTTSPRSLYNQPQQTLFIGTDLNRSLEHLNLDAGPTTSKKPILSPSKLESITQNPWTAGGFWKSVDDVCAAAASTEADVNEFSRSSSQSSGFVSTAHNLHYNSCSSPRSSREHSLNGDIAGGAAPLTEPSPYHFNPINTHSSQQLYYKADNNTFYPVLTPHNMLYIPTNCVPQCPQSPTMSIRSPSAASVFSYAAGNHHDGAPSIRNSGYSPPQNLDTSFGSVKSAPALSRNLDRSFANPSMGLQQHQNFNAGNNGFVKSCFTNSNDVSSRASLFSERPVSRLFKNLSGVPQQQSFGQFRQPQSPL